MVAGVVLLLAAAAGAAARVAVVWGAAVQRARTAHAQAYLPCAPLSSWSAPCTGARAPARLAQDQHADVPAWDSRTGAAARMRPPSGASSAAASRAAGSKAPSSPPSPNARARSPRASCGPWVQDKDAAVQGGLVDGPSWGMRCAIGLCLALHCASLFSNSFILAGRAVSRAACLLSPSLVECEGMASQESSWLCLG